MAQFSLNDIHISQPLLCGGDVVTLDISIRNTDSSGRAIESLQLRLLADTEEYGGLPAGNAIREGLKIAKGKSQRLQMQIPVDLNGRYGDGISAKEYFEAHPACRALPVKLMISASDREYMSIQNLRGLAQLLNRRYHPLVSMFELERATDGMASDEGLNMIASAKLWASGGEASLLQARLYYVENGSPGFELPERYSYPAAPMNENISKDCEASASSEFSDDFAACCAMNGSVDSAWRSSENATGPWLQLKMPRALYDMEITLVNQSYEPVCGPVSGMVYGVENDGNLVQIGAFSGRDGTTAEAQTLIVCTNSARAFDTVRLKITDWDGNAWAAVGEMRISGYDLPVSMLPACIDLTPSIADMLRGVESSASLIPAAFSNGSSWCMMLWFGDEYESARAYCTIGRSFANMHLAGASTGGVCFGGFGTSVQGRPLLESHFPACFHGGIAKLGEDWTELVPLTGTTPAAYGGGSLRCRSIENKRVIAGSLLVKPGSSTIPLAVLPDGFMPAASVFSLNACNGSRIARIAVHGDGDEYPGCLALSWVWDMDKGEKHTASAIWVQCSIEYWVGAGAGSGSWGSAVLGQAILGEMILGGD